MFILAICWILRFFSPNQRMISNFLSSFDSFQWCLNMSKVNFFAAVFAQILLNPIVENGVKQEKCQFWSPYFWHVQFWIHSCMSRFDIYEHDWELVPIFLAPIVRFSFWNFDCVPIWAVHLSRSHCLIRQSHCIIFLPVYFFCYQFHLYSLWKIKQRCPFLFRMSSTMAVLLRCFFVSFGFHCNFR